MPENPNHTIIMVGPGTGMAPFRGFWHERQFLQDQTKAKDLGKITLYLAVVHDKWFYINVDSIKCKKRNLRAKGVYGVQAKSIIVTFYHSI